MLILYFEHSNFGVILSRSGRVTILLVIGGSGSSRITENGPVDIFGVLCSQHSSSIRVC